MKDVDSMAVYRTLKDFTGLSSMRGLVGFAKRSVIGAVRHLDITAARDFRGGKTQIHQ
jgi:hypothetical protein